MATIRIIASFVMVLGFHQFSTLAKTGPTIHQNVVCLVEEPSDDLQDELYLKCNTSGVIHVTSVLHGFHEEALDTKTCVLNSDSECAITNSVFHQKVLRECMGNVECHVPVHRLYLDQCGKSSNYVQVEYECVPDNSVDPDNIVDICGEMLQGTPVSRESGYIKTPGYPDMYSPGVSCSCNLTALDKNAQIMLTLLDIELEDTTDCEWDWLEYTTPHDGWGRGIKMCKSEHVASSDYTGNKTILLNFRADNKVEDRGFWLKYEGRHASGEGAEVMIDCKNYQPNIVRKTAACIPPNTKPQEIYLDCADVGAINVQVAQYGIRPPQTDRSHCDYQVVPQDCIYDATSDDELMRRCMGQTSCNFPIQSMPLPECSKTAVADYFQVKYQCIPEAYETTNIVDICGDVLGGKKLIRHSGYLESPSYPQAYPPNLECQCFLSTEEDANLQLTILDIQLARDTVSEACDADWLRYTESHSSDWGKGRKLCDKPRGAIVDTRRHEIRLDFKSDQSVEDRGFWIRYTAVREDGLHVGVQVMCQSSRGVIMDGVATPKEIPPTFNTGLVIGLSIIGALIIGILIILIILRYKRVRKGKLSEGVESTTVLDKGHTTFRKYSSTLGGTESQPYRHLHNDGQPSRMKDYVEQHPDYDTRPSANPNPSYVNPAYDGSLDPGPYNAAC